MSDELKNLEIGRINNAIDEALRFVDRAEKLLNTIESSKSQFYGYPFPERAAMRRASMDLTKSLAVLRKSMYKED